MIVTVRFRGPLANQMKSGEYRIELDSGTNLSMLLSRLITENETVRDTWSTPEQIDRDTLILCNEVDIGLSGGLNTELNNRDVLVILPLVHGG
jgi:molybdopterin converting factor small subunit